MKKLFNKKVWMVAAAAVLTVIVSAVSLSSCGGGRDLLASGVNAAGAPAKGVLSSLVSTLERTYRYMYAYDQLEAENAALRAQVARLEEEYREYTAMAEENRRLRELLNLGERHSSYVLVPCSVVSWTASNWASSFSIGKGTEAGISLGDPVITELGYVIGKVTEAGPSTSVVTTILDTSSSVGAVIEKSGESAVAQGDFTLMGQGKLKLGYLPEGVKLLAGDVVVTSGKGGVYPQGLVIGRVTDFVSSSSGTGDYAVLAPEAEMDSLTLVYVVTDFASEG